MCPSLATVPQRDPPRSSRRARVPAPKRTESSRRGRRTGRSRSRRPQRTGTTLRPPGQRSGALADRGVRGLPDAAPSRCPCPRLLSCPDGTSRLRSALHEPVSSQYITIYRDITQYYKKEPAGASRCFLLGYGCFATLPDTLTWRRRLGFTGFLEFFGCGVGSFKTGRRLSSRISAGASASGAGGKRPVWPSTRIRHPFLRT